MTCLPKTIFVVCSSCMSCAFHLGQTKTDFTGYGNNAAAANCSGCEVHKGFYRTYESVRVQVQAAVLSFQQQHANASLVCTGHSLGAAVAQHAALDLTISLGLRVNSLYNFGQPRTGNAAFSDYFDASFSNRTFRVTHHKVLLGLLLCYSQAHRKALAEIPNAITFPESLNC